MSHPPTPQALGAARHVLTCPAIAARTAPYISDGWIDWDGIFAASTTMSGGERFLVDIARRICSGETLPSPYEVSGRLDVLNARRVAEAVDRLPRAEFPQAA
jgi:hypothetical protein